MVSTINLGSHTFLDFYHPLTKTGHDSKVRVSFLITWETPNQDWTSRAKKMKQSKTKLNSTKTLNIYNGNNRHSVKGVARIFFRGTNNFPKLKSLFCIYEMTLATCKILCRVLGSIDWCMSIVCLTCNLRLRTFPGNFVTGYVLSFLIRCSGWIRIEKVSIDFESEI